MLCIGRGIGIAPLYPKAKKYKEVRNKVISLTGARSEDFLFFKERAEAMAIGPLPMMKAVSELTRKHNIETRVSLNSIMVDATGMCGGCRVTVGGKVKFTCVDGPGFDGHKIDFDELILRQRRFEKEEKIASKCYFSTTTEA